jgi:DNA-binding NarL/FixJ family response regulator
MYTSKNPANDSSDDSSIFKPPRISLLSDENWLYIRKQYYMSQRELQVAKLVCQGFNNEEIAGSLKVKQGTIKTHIRNIYRRIRVKNRVEMLLRFVDNTANLPTKPEIVIPPLSNVQRPDMTSI